MGNIHRAAVLAALISSILLKLLHTRYTSISKDCPKNWNGDPSPLFDNRRQTYSATENNNSSAIVHNHELTIRGRTFHCFEVKPPKEHSIQNKRNPVLFLHGFPDNYHSFKHQMIRLASEGYASFAPALRGYDINDAAITTTGDNSCNNNRTERDYNILNLAMDAIELIHYFNIDTLHLVGHDWGSPIASTVAKLQPDQIASLTLMAVPELPANPVGIFLRHPDQIIRWWYMIFFQMPLLPELWLRYGGGIEALWRHWGVCYSEERLQSVKETIASPIRRENTVAALGYYRINFLTLLLSNAPISFRNSFSNFIAWFHGLASPGSIEDYVQERYGIKDLNEFRSRSFEMPVLQLAGDSDGCISSDIFHSSNREMGMDRFKRGTKVVVVKDSGHFLQHEQQEEVSNILVDFFREVDTIK